MPFINAILERVAGHECYSFLNVFCGYNQFQIAIEDRSLSTFITNWSTFALNVIPFGLCNACATFQKAMTNAFQEYLRKFIEIFLDDFSIFSSKDSHGECLTKCFEQCKEWYFYH